MAKHELALDLLGEAYRSLLNRSKYSHDRRIWLRDNIRYDTDRGRTPEPKMVKEFDELTRQVKIDNYKIESLLASIQTLEDDDGSD